MPAAAAEFIAKWSKVPATEKSISQSFLLELCDVLEVERPAGADAYGWPWPLSDADILNRVVALNTARAAEEKAGTIRWLRPDYQAKGELLLSGGSAHVEKPKAAAKKPKPTGKQPWPATVPARIKAVEQALAQAERPLTVPALVKQFSRAKESDLAEIVETLCALGRARPGDKYGTFVR